MMTRRFLLGAIVAGAAAATLGWRQHATAGIGEKPGDMALGDPNARVTVIEYFSLTCPHCRWFHKNIFARLKADYVDTGKVQFIARDFPLNAPALHAAMLAHCAGEKRYFTFIHVLFETFEDWTTAYDYPDALARIGELGGLTRDRFQACLADEALENRILQSIEDARAEYGVNATPTVIVNGQRYEGKMSFEAFAKHLDHLLSAS